MSDYPAGLDVRPLSTWPGVLTPAGERRRSPFSAKLSTTLDELERELFHLGAEHPVLEVAIPAEEFRVDGRGPYARAVAAHPGVVLSLPTTTAGPLRFATDLFDRWQDNLRAITLGMESLRRVARYGIVHQNEPYRGFRALEAGTDARMAQRTGLSWSQAVDVIARYCAMTPAQVLADQGRAVKLARAATSPDRHAQEYDASDWDLVDRAALVLKAAAP